MDKCLYLTCVDRVNNLIPEKQAFTKRGKRGDTCLGQMVEVTHAWDLGGSQYTDLDSRILQGQAPGMGNFRVVHTEDNNV